jgi:hypothetical protein
MLGGAHESYGVRTGTGFWNSPTDGSACPVNENSRPAVSRAGVDSPERRARKES